MTIVSVIVKYDREECDSEHDNQLVSDNSELLECDSDHDSEQD